MIALLMLAQTEFSDIREIVRFPNYWQWLLGAGIILLLAAFLVRHRWQKQKADTLPRPVEPPHAKALRQLQDLREQGEELEAEAFTVEVSRILRLYLEEALALPAPEQTSEEFLQQLRTQTWLTPELQKDLEDFMRLADLVKFARQSLDVGQRSRLLDSAIQVVESTRPSAEPEPAAG